MAGLGDTRLRTVSAPAPVAPAAIAIVTADEKKSPSGRDGVRRAFNRAKRRRRNAERSEKSRQDRVRGLIRGVAEGTRHPDADHGAACARTFLSSSP